MRSEVEIKKELLWWKKNITTGKVMPQNLDWAKGRIEQLEWVLEGSPRYSVQELEKIKKWMYDNEDNLPDNFSSGDLYEDAIHIFFALLKDQKKVEAILKKSECP